MLCKGVCTCVANACICNYTTPASKPITWCIDPYTDHAQFMQDSVNELGEREMECKYIKRVSAPQRPVCSSGLFSGSDAMNSTLLWPCASGGGAPCFGFQAESLVVGINVSPVF